MPAAMNNQNLEIKPNNVLSETDKAFMTINYPYPPNHPPADSIWTMNHALHQEKPQMLISHNYLPVTSNLHNWEIRYLTAN